MRTLPLFLTGVALPAAPVPLQSGNFVEPGHFAGITAVNVDATRTATLEDVSFALKEGRVCRNQR